VSIEGLPRKGENQVPLINKAPFKGKIVKLCRSKDRGSGLEEPEGVIAQGDDIVVWLPPNRLYAHA
jgi:hypothetical protein